MEFFIGNRGYKPTSNEYAKAGRLITKAGALGMRLDGYGALDVNLGSGYVYLWLEDYPFTLYVDLGNNLNAVYSCPYDGDETIKGIGSRTTLASLDAWCARLRKQSDKKGTL